MATATSGINGKILVDVGAGLVELPLIKDWTADATRDQFESSSMGAVSKTYNPGLPDYKGTWNGFVDADDDTAYAFCDGEVHEFILYHDRNATAGHRHYDRGYASGSIQSKGGTTSNNEVTINIAAGGSGVTHYLV